MAVTKSQGVLKLSGHRSQPTKPAIQMVGLGSAVALLEARQQKPRATSVCIFGYDGQMQKPWIWLMLLLLPLRLWAGVSMVQSDCHSLTALSAQVQMAQHDSPLGVQAVHGDHGDHGHQAMPEPATKHQATAGHEGSGCIACALCHLSADLPSSSLQLHAPAPTGAPGALPSSLSGHVWPPLTKPPIA